MKSQPVDFGFYINTLPLQNIQEQALAENLRLPLDSLRARGDFGKLKKLNICDFL